jgi:hypothetical protein
MKAKARFPKRLRVMAEYASSGIWIVEPYGFFRHGMISHKRLGLPAELAAQFAEWIEWYWARLGSGPFDLAAFNQKGRSLALALKAFVGPNTEVVFEPETDDRGLRPSEVIQIPS